jgi:hypothetical protein
LFSKTVTTRDVQVVDRDSLQSYEAVGRSQTGAAHPR